MTGGPRGPSTASYRACREIAITSRLYPMSIMYVFGELPRSDIGADLSSCTLLDTKVTSLCIGLEGLQIL